jgi:hypothetical protein
MVGRTIVLAVVQQVQLITETVEAVTALAVTVELVDLE